MAETPKERPAITSERDLPTVLLGFGQAKSYFNSQKDPPDDMGKGKPPDLETVRRKADALKAMNEKVNLLERICSVVPLNGAPPVNFSAELERPFGNARKAILEKVYDIRSYVIHNPKGSGDDQVLAQMLKEFQELEKTYEIERVVSSIRTVDRLMKDGSIEEKYRETVVEIVSRQPPFSPPEDGIFGPLSEEHTDLFIMFTSMWGRALLLKPGDQTFKKEIEKYAQAKEEYEKKCSAVVRPVFIKGINKANNPEGQSAFDWDYVYKELHASLPLPQTTEAPKEVESYLQSQYSNLLQRQKDVERSIRVYSGLLRKDESIPSDDYRKLLSDVILFIIDANEYRADVSNTPVKIDDKNKFMALLALAGVMQVVDKNFFPRTGKLAVLKPEKIAELKTAYEKVKMEFSARGLNLSKLPPFEELLQLKASGVMRGATAEIWRSVSHLGPMEVVLLSLALYFSDDKIKGGSEFMIVMAGFGGMNALSHVMGAARTHQLMSTAMFGQGSKIGRGVASAGKWFVKLKGPPIVKVVGGTAAIVGFHEELEDAGQWTSDNVAQGWARKFGEDFLHALGGPIFDAVGSLKYRALGVKAEGQDPALRFLIEKRSYPIILKFARNPEEFNGLVEKSIRKTSADKIEFYRLEKIDLAPDYKKNVDVTQPVDEDDVTEKNKFDKELGEYGRVKDWRESRWVSRMALRVRAIHSMLESDRESLEALVKKSGLSAAVPSLGKFVTNEKVPVDFRDGLTVTDHLLRASDSSWNIGDFISTDLQNIDGAGAIFHFDKAIRDSKNEELSKQWKAYVTKAGQLGDMVSLFRYLGVYNEKYWLEDKEFARKGVVSEMEYMVRRDNASDRDAHNGIVPLDQVWDHTFGDEKQIPLPPKKASEGTEDAGGAELRNYRDNKAPPEAKPKQ